jgi:glycine/D-amino acid oxidase-like deaminating enzyme
MPLVATVDVLIIGAGIMGASCALRISERGLNVAVLEAQDAPATGSTGKSVAGVRVQYTEEVNIRLSWESIQEYRRFSELYGAEAQSGYLPIGYLLLVPPQRWPAHLASVALQQRAGVPVQVLSLDEAQRLVPFDPAHLAGATHGPADGVIDPHSVTLAYLRLARARGAALYLGTPLLSAQRAGSGWRVETPRGAFEAGYLVNAAGCWAGEVARRAGLDVPVQPVRRNVYATAPLPWRHAYPLTIDFTSGFYLRSEGRRILFGRSNPHEPPGFTEGLDWEWFEHTLAVGIKRFPWLAETQLDRQASWWGYYEVTPDHNPILGRMPAADNWINVAGFSGHGVQQAAAIGRVIAEEIVLGKAQSINIDPLRLERFASQQSGREHNIV